VGRLVQEQAKIIATLDRAGDQLKGILDRLG
jgi:hypothetical protein